MSETTRTVTIWGYPEGTSSADMNIYTKSAYSVHTPSSIMVAFDLTQISAEAAVESVILTAQCTEYAIYPGYEIHQASGYISLGNYNYAFPEFATNRSATEQDITSSRLWPLGGTLRLVASGESRYVTRAKCRFSLQITYNDARPDTPSTATFDAAVIDAGQTVTTTLTAAKDTYTHTISYTLGTHAVTHTLAAGVLTDTMATEYSWIDAMPDSDSGTMRVVVTTFKGDGTAIGDPASYTILVNIPARDPEGDGVVPSAGFISLETVNPEGTPAFMQSKYVTGISRLKITLSSVGPSYGSTVQEITFVGWGDRVVKTGAEVSSLSRQVYSFTTDVLKTAGRFTIRAVVKDARGRSRAAAVRTAGDNIIEVISYEMPALDSVSVTRCELDAQGNPTPNDRGDAITVSATFHCDQSGSLSGNTVTGTLNISPEGQEAWLAEETALANDTEAYVIFPPVDPQTGVRPALATDVSYDLRITLTDNVMSVENHIILPSNKFVIHFHNSGDSVAIGDVAEAPAAGETGRFTVNKAWTVCLGEDIRLVAADGTVRTLAQYINDLIAAAIT